jgi:hypothetical protein
MGGCGEVALVDVVPGEELEVAGLLRGDGLAARGSGGVLEKWRMREFKGSDSAS